MGFWRNLGLKWKLVIQMLMIGLLPLLFMIYFSEGAFEDIRKINASTLQSTASSLADKIDRNIFERVGDVKVFGINRVAHDRALWYKSDSPIVASMNDYVVTYNFYFVTMLVDPDGRVIAVNTTDKDRNPVDTREFYTRNYKNSVWFQDVLAGRFYTNQAGNVGGEAGFTGAVIIPPQVDAEIAKIYPEEQGMTMGFAAPVHDDAGKLIAVWRNYVRLSLVEDMVASSYGDLLAQGLPGAEITVLDGEGRVIVDYDPMSNPGEVKTLLHRDFNILFKLNLVEKGNEAAIKAVRHKQNGFTYSRHARKNVIQASGYAHHRGVLGFPGMNWSVLIRISNQTLNGPITAIQEKFQITIAAVALLVFLIGLTNAEHIAEPIQRLSRKFKNFAAGKFAAVEKMPVRGRDEIGQLSESFNRLSDNILAYLRHSRELVRGNPPVRDEFGLQGEFENTLREMLVMARNLAGVHDAEHRHMDNLRAAMTEIREKEGRLRAILDTMVDGVISIDVNGHILLFNSAAERLFGYRTEEIMGKSVNMLMPEPYRSEHDRYLQKYLSTGEAHIIGFGREVEGLRKDGTIFPVFLAVAEQTLEDGTRRFIGTVRDFTRRKEAEMALVLARETAEKANRAKSDFLSRMSHELRTPLNAILGFSQLLEFNTEGNLTDKQLENIGHILRTGNHLLDLINETLDLSRIESGGLKIEKENLSLSDLILECMLIGHALAEKAGITLHDETATASSLVVQVDRVRFKQCLLNLISNAIKYNRPGGSVRVDCRERSSGFAEIGVSDTGYGISEEKLSSLFEPFERLGAEQTEVEGTGIGLTITKRLMEIMGGAIFVNNQPGQGCRFVLHAPLGLRMAKVSREPRQIEIAGSPAAEKNVNGKIQTVLYVEDNKDNQLLVKYIFQQRPRCRLVIANDGLEGLRQAEELAPDLILLDIQIPGMDGMELVRRLRASERNRSAKILAVSAQALPDEVARAIDAGFNDYLTKPIVVGKFLEVIDRYLDQTGETSPVGSPS